MSGGLLHFSITFLKRLLICVAVLLGLAAPFIIGGAVSSFRDWRRGVKRVNAREGIFTIWTGVWVPYADLDLGGGTTVRIYSGEENFSRQLGYAVLVNGKEVVDGCGWGSGIGIGCGWGLGMRHDLDAGHVSELHFSVVPSVDSALFGVVEDSQPDVILIAHDTRTGVTWPHDCESGRIQHLIIQRFRAEDPAKGYVLVTEVTEEKRRFLKVYAE